MASTVPACCDFCDKSEKEVRLISARNSHICVECIALCVEILEGEPERRYERVSQELDRLVAYGCEPQPYSFVAPHCGYNSPRDRDLFMQLGRALREDHAAGKPLRSSLVINKQLGMPGEAYFAVCRELGYDIPAGKEIEFWNQQVTRLTA